MKPLRLVLAVSVALSLSGLLRAADSEKSGEVLPTETRKAGEQARAKALEFLLKSQKDDGSWGDADARANPATTALVLRALLGSGAADAKHPAVVKGLAFLLKLRQADGSFHRGVLQNYNTAIVMMTLHATGSAEHKPAVEAAQKYLLANQYGADEQIDELAKPDSAAKKDPRYGGIGYAAAVAKGGPDLSNTAFVADALRDTGLPADHPAWKRMQTFLARVQVRSESNDQPWAKDVGDDGSFVYDLNPRGPKVLDPATGKELLRGYGSMTYAGFKSFLYAGVAADDPRVKSAWTWIGRNYTLEENPNMGKSGMYYYYMTFAKALAASGKDTVQDLRANVARNWREDVVKRLVSVQAADGSWTNTDRRWMETDPYLVTAYGLLALEHALKTK